MSLQWMFVAGFLYFEIFCVFLFLIPFVTPPRWQQIFKSRLVSIISSYSHIYLNVFIAILVFLCVDALREVKKYSFEEIHDPKNNPNAEIMNRMVLFRAQRNAYIAGFAFFLCLVLKRLAYLIRELAVFEAKHSAAIKQAEGASKQCTALMKKVEELEGGEEKGQGQGDAKALSKELAQLKEELKLSQQALKKSETNLEACKKQAEGTNKEYDRLLAEHTKLQEAGGSSGKKDN